ncbi:MAG: hypothetical protein CMN28_14605 [Salinisphaeraceae bacterium]|nr:hypothetical protein [Salinisphaeraceae bacterium]
MLLTVSLVMLTDAVALAWLMVVVWPGIHTVGLASTITITILVLFAARMYALDVDNRRQRNV